MEKINLIIICRFTWRFLKVNVLMRGWEAGCEVIDVLLVQEGDAAVE